MGTCARITFAGWRISRAICCESSAVTRSPDPEGAPMNSRASDATLPAEQEAPHEDRTEHQPHPPLESGDSNHSGRHDVFGGHVVNEFEPPSPGPRSAIEGQYPFWTKCHDSGNRDTVSNNDKAENKAVVRFAHVAAPDPAVEGLDRTSEICANANP